MGQEDSTYVYEGNINIPVLLDLTINSGHLCESHFCCHVEVYKEYSFYFKVKRNLISGTYVELTFLVLAFHSTSLFKIQDKED